MSTIAYNCRHFATKVPPAERATSKIVKEYQDTSLFENLRARQKCQNSSRSVTSNFRHFSTIFARHQFSGPNSLLGGSELSCRTLLPVISGLCRLDFSWSAECSPVEALGWVAGSGSGIPEVRVESATGHGLVIFHDVVNGLATARKKSSSNPAPQQELCHMCSAPSLLRADFLGRGCFEAPFSEKKGFSVKRGRESSE